MVILMKWWKCNGVTTNENKTEIVLWLMCHDNNVSIIMAVMVITIMYEENENNNSNNENKQ